MAINNFFPKTLHKIKNIQSISSHSTFDYALLIIHFMTNI
jgi:hypothetical protein